MNQPIQAAVLCALLASCAPPSAGSLERSLLSPLKPAHQWVWESERLIDGALLQTVTPLLSPDEHIVHSVTRTFVESGELVHRVELFDTATNESRKLSVSATGVVVDFQKLLGQERQAIFARQGKLSNGLFATIGAAPKPTIQVRFHHTASMPQRPAIPTALNHASQLAAMKASLSFTGGALAKDIVARGGKVLWRAEYGPFIEAEVAVQDLLAFYGRHPLVDGVELSGAATPPEPASADSTNDLKLPSTFYWRYPQPSYFGDGVKAGIVAEKCSIGHSYLGFPNLSHQAGFTSCTTDAQCRPACDDVGPNNEPLPSYCRNGRCTSYHQTMIAGMLGNFEDAYYLSPRGAPHVDLYLANSWSGHSANLNWLFGQGVRVASESFGGGYTDVSAQDWYSISGLNILRAAGNGGVGTRSECAALMPICVAGYRRVLNPPYFTFYSDTSTRNFDECSGPSPTGCDREVPDISFKAQDVYSTSTANPGAYAVGSGTSYAAPAGAALVALMVNRWPDFTDWPEATRAALMASATIDILTPVEGKSYSDYRAPDESDGAGVPDPQRLASMMSQNRVWRYVWTPADFVGGKKSLGYVNVAAGQTIRAVLSWDSCPGQGLKTDFDLHLLDPSNNRVANGASYDGAYEIVEVTNTVAGTYTIEVQYFTWDQCYEGNQIYAAVAHDVR